MKQSRRKDAGKRPRRAPADRFLRASAILTCALAVIALGYAAGLDRLLDAYQGFYDENNRWRQPLLEARLRGYVWLLAAMALACAIWTVAIRLRSLPDRIFARGNRLLGRAGRTALIATLGAAVAGAGLWFSHEEWVRVGRPCYDHYCTFALLMHRWLFEDSPGAQETLLHFMRTEGHGNSPLPPLIISLAMRLAGLGVAGAYRLSCGLATAGTLALVWISILPRLGIERRVRFAVLVVLGTSLVLVRSAIFLQTDAFVLLWATAVLACALDLHESGRLSRGVLCFLLIATGLFVKLSFHPFLALVPAWYGLDALRARKDRPVSSAPGIGNAAGRLAWRVAIFSILPLALFLLFQHVLQTRGEFARELAGMSTVDSHLPYVVTSLLHAALIPGVLIALGWRDLRRPDHLLLAWVLLYLLSLWATRASGWDRFYLVVIPPLAAVGGRGLARLSRTLSPAMMWLFVLLAASLNYLALALGLYY